MSSKQVKLRFCPYCSDLLYPQEDKEQQKLLYVCKHCHQHKSEVDKEHYCVYVNNITKSKADKSAVVIQDVREDPTLPRTNDYKCEACGHDKACFFSASTMEGMTLFLNCLNCGHRWRDNI